MSTFTETLNLNSSNNLKLAHVQADPVPWIQIENIVMKSYLKKNVKFSHKKPSYFNLVFPSTKPGVICLYNLSSLCFSLRSSQSHSMFNVNRFNVMYLINLDTSETGSCSRLEFNTTVVSLHGAYPRAGPVIPYIFCTLIPSSCKILAVEIIL